MGAQSVSGIDVFLILGVRACLRKELELNDLTHEGVAEAAWLNQEKDEDHAKGKRNDSYSMRI